MLLIHTCSRSGPKGPVAPYMGYLHDMRACDTYSRRVGLGPIACNMKFVIISPTEPNNSQEIASLCKIATDKLVCWQSAECTGSSLTNGWWQNLRFARSYVDAMQKYVPISAEG